MTVQGSRFAADKQKKPSLEEVEAAFRAIIRWSGDDPLRKDLIETPSRAARAFKEYFAGYNQDPIEILNKTFGETGGYEEMVILRGIALESHCEHHLTPIVGQAWVAYVPNGRVVCLLKLARVVDAYAKRLQIQERLTSEIASAVQQSLQPQGVGVVLKATHHCMSSREVHKTGAEMVTSCMLGCFRDNPSTRQEFLAIANQP
ncbi:GTP cyclohydrolase I FolE [Tardiphaga sp. vice352]|uniref:GTP cyclohydrolase I FolE n=1 Tax=unclassified Tardiphaga TaxID=2631404 RepID=UPI0011642AB9|nr:MULTISPECIES: GTP cyclohydrolase I FolE [unclassified Tardiphaga]QDM15871.1 GTP cyclohydrolase I FolE [Tardiphaga sp. vice278]QDM20972.1 GTP cyclohydrolase I FolE [Tardiphaga sp. vice154]QDM26065.1 GTP cyclohydrolase I FolE [Tardiphaga sp. vice304]QDM31217.1 GTP cyclohydrolase I FolE [Tardiphaga sp. vice352]